jgi:hypothetical protein
MIQKFLSKLFFGNSECVEDIKESALRRRIENLKCIWNHPDYGLERLVGLFLALSQFIFPGTYVRQVFGRKSAKSRDVSMEIFIFLKFFYAFIFVKYHLCYNNFYTGILIWFFLETILYVPTLIFASDYLVRPRSYTRSILLFALNYMEVSVCYAGFYTASCGFNKSFYKWYDAIYYSFITGSTTGYGDYFPVTGLGEFLVVSQTIVFLMFIALFFNIFSSKLEIKGYFQ